MPIPVVEDPHVSGTTAGGLVEAIARTSDGRLVAIPYSGPWTARALGGLFEVAATLTRPVTLVANLATRQLWGGHPRPDQLLAYLLHGEQTGPEPDWDVGHFACVIGRASGPGGRLYADRRHLPLARRRGRAPAARRSASPARSRGPACQPEA